MRIGLHIIGCGIEKNIQKMFEIFCFPADRFQSFALQRLAGAPAHSSDSLQAPTPNH